MGITPTPMYHTGENLLSEYRYWLFVDNEFTGGLKTMTEAVATVGIMERTTPGHQLAVLDRFAPVNLRQER